MPEYPLLDGEFIIIDEIPRLVISEFTNRNFSILIDLKDRFTHLGSFDPECELA